MNLTNNVESLLEKLDRHRAVTLCVHYCMAASDQQMAETGKPYTSIVSPNFFVLPPVVDTLETDGLERLRKVWLQALHRQGLHDDTVLTNHRPENLEARLHHIMGEALSPEVKTTNLDEAFVRAAKFPVPPQYDVLLPTHPAELRRKIINTLVPFQETKKTLLRLEDELDLPMRVVRIGHTRASSLDELRAVRHLH